MQSVLVLNATYQPLSIVPAKRAIQLMLAGKATPLDGSGRYFSSSSERIEVPYVILMSRVVKQGKARKPGWSRHGVLARDNYSCVYCGNTATTIDHVIPQSQGGPTSYENCVAACQPCNSKKANRTLKQLGWTIPKKELKAPSHISRMLSRASSNPHQYEAWKTYINMFV
jgi:5-methylcytosine-specific restriction endonuclease McrA